MQDHITIRNTADIPSVVLSSKVFLCPFCDPRLFSSRSSIRTYEHLREHRKTAVSFGDKLIYRCNLGCKDRKHYHCFNCSVTVLQKTGFLAHLRRCVSRKGLPSSTSSVSSSIQQVKTFVWTVRDSMVVETEQDSVVVKTEQDSVVVKTEQTPKPVSLPHESWISTVQQVPQHVSWLQELPLDLTMKKIMTSSPVQKLTTSQQMFTSSLEESLLAVSQPPTSSPQDSMLTVTPI
ncbi:uncharacterized protein LOC114656227 [Erpetoichthys calabaricus]|uniref:uncharacterized protein LOC114656227 n=1 Tax=Erpetoichthys calabaricus TaxID=27687 RepID=UPI0010A01C40|nr:uncharacterized protein LOC114656227 [Erpetoichthys calabaricus]